VLGHAAAAQRPDEPFVLFTRFACSIDFREDRSHIALEWTLGEDLSIELVEYEIEKLLLRGDVAIETHCSSINDAPIFLSDTAPSPSRSAIEIAARMILSRLSELVPDEVKVRAFPRCDRLFAVEMDECFIFPCGSRYSP
jgi:hypothetical protein